MADAGLTTYMIGAGLGLSAAQTVHGVMQADAAASAQESAMRQQADHQRQVMERQYEMEQRRRQNLLERSQARARASFGARGLSTTEGSAGALLEGIETRAGEEEQDARSIFDYRLGGLDAGLASSLSRIDAGRPDLLSTGLTIGRQVADIVEFADGTEKYAARRRR
ncbi:MAG: hypothetical protein ACKO1J_02745 [Tagaea sp.]